MGGNKKLKSRGEHKFRTPKEITDSFEIKINILLKHVTLRMYIKTSTVLWFVAWIVLNENYFGIFVIFHCLIYMEVFTFVISQLCCRDNLASGSSFFVSRKKISHTIYSYTYFATSKHCIAYIILAKTDIYS